MKDNFHLSLVGKNVQLVPYRKKFVPRYHEWMQDEYILAMTASEPLTVEEEYEMQQSWRDDKKKCTFIVLEAPSSSETCEELERMAGDVNLFLSRSYEDDSLVSEIDIMIAEQSLRRCGLGRESVQMMMWYGCMHLQISRFFAKINKDNASSIRLFER
jgi:RimJ/RimL family protein N-acetyltransferase